MHVRAFVPALFVLGSALLAGAQPPSSSAVTLIERSGFIFKGTVQRVAASNVKALPASPTTIVVRVDEILKAPESLASYRGQDVTVQLERASRLRPGQQAVFYTTSLLYGENLAVKEVSTVTTSVDSKRLADQIAQADRQSAEQALTVRIASSALVISGRVVDVAPLRPTEAGRPRSEHDPDFWRADVEISAVVKGQQAATGRLAVFFAHSADERWLLSPKYTPGQNGVFLLHTEEMQTIGQPGYSTLDRLDFQPPSQLELVRRLVNARR